MHGRERRRERGGRSSCRGLARAGDRRAPSRSLHTRYFGLLFAEIKRMKDLILNPSLRFSWDMNTSLGGGSYSEEVLVEALLGPRLRRTHLSLFRFTFRSLVLWLSLFLLMLVPTMVGQWGPSITTSLFPSANPHPVAAKWCKSSRVLAFTCSVQGWLAVESSKAEVGQQELEPRVEPRAQGRSRRSVLNRHTQLIYPPSSPHAHTHNRTTHTRVIQSKNEPRTARVWVV